eukprot:scaffold56005_cov19-Tisochrysis_lutea.AAC.1
MSAEKCVALLPMPIIQIVKTTALAEAVRQQKATQAEEQAALVQKYGEEGAAAMQMAMLSVALRREEHILSPGNNGYATTREAALQ